MTHGSISARAPELVFGVYRLLPQQRLLYRVNTPVRIGCRAREILVTLVERAGEIVKKHELVARVWPNTVVEEGTLRVHIAGLRKALNDGKEGMRFVENVTGLGYRFVAPVAFSQDSRPPTDDTSLSVEELRELQRLREENTRLRRVVTDLTLEKHILEDKVGELQPRRTNAAPVLDNRMAQQQLPEPERRTAPSPSAVDQHLCDFAPRTAGLADLT